MFSISLYNFTGLLSGQIQNDPGVIVGPISKFLGFILNFLFNFVYSMSEANSLGISIILFTIIVRILMLPLAVSSQKSMHAMQKVQPEVLKINEKYGDSKDPEIQKKKAAETQALYAKHKVNPLGGCLPLFIQMPVFISLSFIMRHAYMYIDVIQDVYYGIAQKIIDTPAFTNIILTDPLMLQKKIPAKMQTGFDFTVIDNLAKVLNECFVSEWQMIVQNFPSIESLYNQKVSIEMFFSLNLVEKAGYAFPGILIPILSAAFTFLSSWIMNKQQAPPKDDNAKMQQKMMLIVMPIMMGFMTVGFPAGVGLYWITSSAFQVIQQPLIKKYFDSKDKNKEVA